MPNNAKIGKVVTEFDEAGLPTSSVFVPAEYDSGVPLEAAPIPVKDESQAVAYSLRVLASYFIHIGNVETHDPDLETVKHNVLLCERHANGMPRRCEVEFYMEAA